MYSLSKAETIAIWDRSQKLTFNRKVFQWTSVFWDRSRNAYYIHNKQYFKSRKNIFFLIAKFTFEIFLVIYQ